MANGDVLNNPPDGIPVVIMSFNRPDYLKRTIDSVLAAYAEIRPILYKQIFSGIIPPKDFHFFISQDGHDRGVSETIDSYSDRGVLHFRYDWNVWVCYDAGVKISYILCVAG